MTELMRPVGWRDAALPTASFKHLPNSIGCQESPDILMTSSRQQQAVVMFRSHK